MVDKCVIYGCKSGYKSNANSIPFFHFPLQKVDLLAKWTKFVNRLDWSLTSNSVILNGKRKKLNWKLNPVPTIYPESVLSKPSSLPTLTGFRKSPKSRAPFLKIAHTMYIHNLIKNLFDFALVRLK